MGALRPRGSRAAQRSDPTGTGAATRRAAGRAAAEFGIYLLARQPPLRPWPSRWVRWPDFGLPRDRVDACVALVEAWQRAEHQRVEIACAGGVGRTGTALACLVVLEGRSGAEAVDYVRKHYHRRAVETVWQRRYVSGFLLRS